MKLDRALQRHVLTALRDHYPEQIQIDSLALAGDPNLQPNLFYLREHGLIQGILRDVIGAEKSMLTAEITATGLDFLEDDGGLSSILGTVTVKIHADTIRDLLEARISELSIPETEKRKFIDHLRELPSEALKTLTTRLVEAGLDRLPDAVQWLSTVLGR